MSSFALFRFSILQCNCELQRFGDGYVRTGLKAAKPCLREKNTGSRTPQHICTAVPRMDIRGVIFFKNANDTYDEFEHMRIFTKKGSFVCKSGNCFRDCAGAN